MTFDNQRWASVKLGSIPLLFALALSAYAQDANLTPGVINPAITDPCKTKWGLDRRHVTMAMKRQVFTEYQIPYSRHSEFEVDHRVPRECGGADDTRNLWPQPWKGSYNAHWKDRLENYVHRQVCSGAMTLSQAQAVFLGDWQKEYDKHFIPKARPVR